jgi:hypothetical protein
MCMILSFRKEVMPFFTLTRFDPYTLTRLYGDSSSLLVTSRASGHQVYNLLTISSCEAILSGSSCWYWAPSETSPCQSLLPCPEALRPLWLEMKLGFGGEGWTPLCYWFYSPKHVVLTWRPLPLHAYQARCTPDFQLTSCKTGSNTVIGQPIHAVTKNIRSQSICTDCIF